MDAAFASPRPNPVQRRPAKIVISDVPEPPRQHRRNQSSDSTTKVHLSYIPPGCRTPPYNSSSSSGGSSPTSVSPSKSEQTRYNFDQRHAAIAHQGPNAVYMNNGATVQLLSLKTHRNDPPKQLLPLASHKQSNYSPSDSGCSQSSVACCSIYGACQHNQIQEGQKQMLNLRPYANSEVTTQDVCAFCYQFAVHYANARGVHLPRVADRGYWRGHVMNEGDRIVCPRLLRRVCALCGATGQSAHLNNYCPVTKKHISSY